MNRRITDIIMSAPMVRAILREIETAGTGKTETRRLTINKKGRPSKWVRIKPGDRLYVRENFCEDDNWLTYQADKPDADVRWTPSIHMEREISRITLDVTAVKIERLQVITHSAVYREGLRNAELAAIETKAGRGPMLASDCFAWFWDSLHGTGAWDINPEVVAVTFKPYLCNIDRMKETA